MVRTNTEIVSNLPIFKAKRFANLEGTVIVTCPRDDCNQKFVVVVSAWFKPRRLKDKTVIVGRPCPYCSRTGRLPDRAGIR